VPTACNPRVSVLCRRRCAHEHRRASGRTALPQGPSLRSRLCCPGPSSLNRPHPSPSQAHRDFTLAAYTRCPRCAIRPRRPASGSVLSLLVPSRHAVLSDPGDLVGDFHPSAPPTTLAFASLGQARRSRHSHHPFRVGCPISGLHWFAFATACRVASLLDGSDRVSPAAETFTSGLSTCRSPFTLPDITTVALGYTPPAGLSPAGTAASIAALQSRKP